MDLKELGLYVPLSRWKDYFRDGLSLLSESDAKLLQLLSPIQQFYLVCGVNDQENTLKRKTMQKVLKLALEQQRVSIVSVDLERLRRVATRISLEKLKMAYLPKTRKCINKK